MQPGVIQGPHRGLEANALLAPEQRLGWHPAIFKNNVGSVGAAKSHLLVAGPDRDARNSSFDEKRGDTCCLLLRTGTRKYGEDAGVRRIGGEPLGAVDDVM